jgi:hypothetical protein
MRSLVALITLGCLPAIALATAGCASSSPDARVDVMFRKTDAVAEDVLELTTPALVNDINGAYEIEGVGYFPSAKLAASGEVESGENRVFVLRFIDLGDISVLRTDDKQVSLRAEFGPEGKVVAALLGSTSGAVNDAFVAYGNDVFEAGSWELLYDGPDVVVGRFDIKFKKYRASGNFRAPRLR